MSHVQAQPPPRRANRAAAALATVSGTRVFVAHAHPLLMWPPATAATTASTTTTASSSRVPRGVVVRYDNFAQLVDAHRGHDTLAAARARLAAMQAVPVRRDALAALSDAALRVVFDYLGHTSRAAVQLTATCRRLRALGLSTCVWTRVCLVPMLLPSLHTTQQSTPPPPSSSPPTLSTTTTLPHAQAVRTFFAPHTRGPHVRQFALVDSHYAATCDTALQHHAALPCASPSWLPWVLQLCTQMPMLSQLDVRGVHWPRAAHFLSDLHLVAPQLRVLKMSTSLYDTWTPGWWQRHVHLSTLVIGSRREHAATTTTTMTTATKAADGAAATALALGVGDGDGDASTMRTWQLHSDVLQMLSSSSSSAQRGLWCCKWWCPLAASSLQRLLLPATPLHSLAELTVNVLAADEATLASWAATAAAAAAASSSSTTTVVAGAASLSTGTAGSTSTATTTTTTTMTSGSAAEHDGSDATTAATDAKQRARSRRGGGGGGGGANSGSGGSGDDADAHWSLPHLRSLTLANVRDATAAAAMAELLQRISTTAAPRLQYVTLCNTTRLAPQADKPRRRRAPAQAA